MCPYFLPNIILSASISCIPIDVSLKAAIEELKQLRDGAFGRNDTRGFIAKLLGVLECLGEQISDLQTLRSHKALYASIIGLLCASLITSIAFL